MVQKNSGLCRVITYKQSVGLDPLDKYDKAEFLAIQKADCNGEKDKKRTKRKFDDTLEEGEGKLASIVIIKKSSGMAGCIFRL